jgi:phage-related protein (TIGR01555 family)
VASNDSDHRDDALASGVVAQLAAQVYQRADSWMNAMIGLGGARDKTAATTYSACFRVLGSQELTAMFATEGLSRKLVDLYPREALRPGFELGGWSKTRDQDTESAVTKFLEPFNVLRTLMTAAIWGRLYGGCKVWMGSTSARVDLTTPFVPGEPVDFLRAIDRRFIDATTMSPDNLDVLGNPIMYRVSLIDGGATIDIHKSRLVHFGGALTDEMTKRSLAGWDLSVLQVAYDTLASDGELWKSTRLLVSEASVGVMKIKGLWSLIAGKQKERLTSRLQIQAMSRSVARNMVLDADGEDYTRVNTTFAGLPDLNDKSLQRIAAVAEIPVALLGQQASGLNADGSSDIDWWLQRVDAYRVQEIEPAARQIVIALLSQPGSPVAAQAQDTSLKWGPLHQMSPKERAEIYSLTASADATYLDKQVLLPEEVGLSRFGDDGYSQETEIDRDLRTEALEHSREHMLTAAEEGPPDPADRLPEDGSEEDPEEAPEDGEDEGKRADAVEFNEADHPRAENGEFGPGGGGGAKAAPKGKAPKEAKPKAPKAPAKKKGPPPPKGTKELLKAAEADKRPEAKEALDFLTPVIRERKVESNKSKYQRSQSEGKQQKDRYTSREQMQSHAETVSRYYNALGRYARTHGDERAAIRYNNAFLRARNLAAGGKGVFVGADSTREFE